MAITDLLRAPQGMVLEAAQQGGSRIRGIAVTAHNVASGTLIAAEYLLTTSPASEEEMRNSGRPPRRLASRPKSS